MAKKLFMAAAYLCMAATAQTCNLWQACVDNADVVPGQPLPDKKCSDASAVTMPVFPEGGYPAALMTNTVGQSALDTACPFIDYKNDKLCCNSDNAQIMGKFYFL